MTVDKLNQIYDDLKLHSKEYAIDSAFQLFIDNQITVVELEKLLLKFDYVLPEDFFYLNKYEQKKYHQHKINKIYIENGTKTIKTYSCFNRIYYYIW